MKRVTHFGLKLNDAFEKGSDILPNNSSSEKEFNVIEVEIFKIIFESKIKIQI